MFTALDDGVHDARHFGGDCGERFALEISAIAISGYVALIFLTKAVLALPDGDLRRHPERAA